VSHQYNTAPAITQQQKQKKISGPTHPRHHLTREKIKEKKTGSREKTRAPNGARAMGHGPKNKNHGPRSAGRGPSATRTGASVRDQGPSL